MTLHCDICLCCPDDNNAIYFNMRTSSSGKDFDGIADSVVCKDCLEEWVIDYGVATIVSVVRIENPMSTTGD